MIAINQSFGELIFLFITDQWTAAADGHRHISVANNPGLRRMIAGRYE
jgi:transposase